MSGQEEEWLGLVEGCTGIIMIFWPYFPATSRCDRSTRNHIFGRTNMDDLVYSEKYYDPSLFKNEGLGTNVAIIDLDINLTNKDLQELNAGINQSRIFVYSEPVGKGGLGDAFTSPELVETITIIIGDILINLFASFAYDGLKTAIKRSINKIREKKGNPKAIGYEIRHKNTSFIIIARDGMIDEELLDLSLRALLGDVMLREEQTDSKNLSMMDQGVG